MDRNKYGVKRERVLARAQQLLDGTDFTFIKNNLRREARKGLDSALADMLKRLPDVVSEDLEKTNLIKVVRKTGTGKRMLLLQVALTRVRSALSHDSGSFEFQYLETVISILDRAV